MVEIIPKKSTKELPFKNIILFVAGAVLIAVVLSYVVIVRSETKALAVLEDLEGSIAKFGTREDKAMEAKVFDSEKIIKDFSILSANRRKSSNFFSNFANLIHPQIWLSEVNLDAAQLQASVSGQSPDFKVLEQQLIFFQNQEDFIDSFELPKITIGKDGGAEFDINFNFKQEIFN